jgi:hypothetical protein
MVNHLAPVRTPASYGTHRGEAPVGAADVDV